MSNAGEIAIDIETIQWEKSVPFIPEKGPRDKTEPWDKCKFDPNYTQICCIGFKTDGACKAYTIEEMGEAKLLDIFWSVVQKYSKIITYNGLSFDLPFIYRRSWYEGIKPTILPDALLKKYETYGLHVDVRAILSQWDKFAPGKLDLYAALKLDQCKMDGVDGSQVQSMWDAGKFDEIREYCKQDCELTWALYQSLKGFYF